MTPIKTRLPAAVSELTPVRGRFIRHIATGPALLLCGAFARAGPAARAEYSAKPLAAAPAGKVDFVKQIKPVLEMHCVKCHGTENPSSGYEIYTKDKAFKAGDSDMAPITPNNSSESQVYQLVSSKSKKQRMPQKADPLDPATIALIKKWIDEGADWPDKVELDETKAKQQKKDEDKKPQK